MEKKYSLRDISRALNRAVSALYYEIKRNSVSGIYDPEKAQHKAYVRRHAASFRGRRVIAHKELRKFVEHHLLAGQSPGAISGRIKYQEKNLPYVSKDTIYRYLRSPYGKIIGMKLKKKKRPKGGAKKRTLSDRVFIEDRPEIIEKRERVGDIEADFIVSCRSGYGILLTATDRKLRISFIEIIYNISIDEVHGAFQRIKERFPEMETMTLDNDILFRMHRTLASLLGLKIYFCHPYHSWEKGSIENANRFIRNYIPKGSNLSLYTKREIALVERKCNDRFMECLNYKTPSEALNKYRQKQKNSLRAVNGIIDIDDNLK